MIEIIKPWEDKLSTDLSRSVWKFGDVFRNDSIYLVLNTLVFQNRQTKRHGWVTVKHWERILRRDNTISDEEVIIPPTVKEEAIRIMQHRIFVTKEYPK